MTPARSSWIRVGASLALVLLVCAPGPSHAGVLRTHERSDWMLGLGIGYGRGTFESPGGSRSSYTNGAVPQMQLGRLFGQHAMLSVFYEAWMLELGQPVTDSLGVKFRRSLQNFGVAATYFPGNPSSAAGGIFLRANVGVGWAGTAGLVVQEGEAQHNAPRIDEWGVGVSAAAGYEFRLSPHFAAGLATSFEVLDIGEKIVDRAGFGALLLTMSVYF